MQMIEMPTVITKLNLLRIGFVCGDSVIPQA